LLIRERRAAETNYSARGHFHFGLSSALPFSAAFAAAAIAAAITVASSARAAVASVGHLTHIHQ
jgi:hypothetical protein